ncbi:MAG: hypothetical protein HKN22_02275, partial [Bacteroidia bacterium]|nr:hypothetical protein [Bacteroidia bacterium]
MKKMKMNLLQTTKVFIMMLGFATVLTACQKDDNNDDTTPGNTTPATTFTEKLILDGNGNVI